MTTELSQRLRKYGYRKQDLESLFNELPQTIWVTVTEKNIKRQRASFVITRKDGSWITSLTVATDESAEIYVLHTIKEKNITDAIGAMLVFLEEKKMLEPSV